MIRWITVLSALLLLAGCVTTREVIYRDRYYDDGYASSRYEDRYYEDGSYYAPPVSGRGDYYYRAPHWRASHAWYWDYPAYYSVFWPLYRSWYDPFFHPGYYYGVTYYPRNYFSIGFSRGWGWGGSYSLFYSPYRYSWVDNYYDWTPWHRHHHQRYSAPRYGSALNEAERLARMGDFGRSHGAPAYSSLQGRDNALDRYGRTRDDTRAADYGREPAPRQAPGFSGFGVRDANAEVRRLGAGSRAAPLDSSEADPVAGESRAGSRAADYGDRAPRGGWNADRSNPPADVRRTAGGWDEYAVPRAAGVRPGRYQRAPATGDVGAERGYDYGRALPRERVYSRELEPGWRGAPREAYAAPVPRGRAVAPHYAAPARGYDAGPAEAYAPAPRAEPRFESHYEARPEPRYESRPEPRYESHSEPRYESRSESHGDSDVRRVGSDRED